MFIWRTMLENRMFPELAGYIRSRLAQSRVMAGRDRLYFNQLAEARYLFRQAFTTAPGWQPCASYLLSVLPLTIRKAAGVSRA